ncbi:hypothetical protein F5878DRAFT_648982 [Lentinula raphanica]|uniref:Uncharacterized protein n=1 Tax=Lentinula raphanica TaxID=153919 RepID=A0AA38PJU2_9AGAR|nr:hypothetical protein C8R42DRAFT_696155 [Lentinula raphanica]KAJ3826187.1 hypothetical protein F5880DRAFT_1622350 [Lentinula raphanica]KAJ3844263.1 hypothetical protein F5878DRAFT_648982 [Lentinula raphanica]
MNVLENNSRGSYLSAEQRLNYLVKIDSDGKLRWARNNELVDTTAGRWKDSGNGGGIVPEDMPAQPVQRRGSFESVAASSSSVQSDAVIHYLEPPKGKSHWSKLFYRYFTVRGVTNRLLRTSLKRNTWLYTSDKNCDYLLAGGIVTSAGLISVKDGLIHTLSPLSGHYR